MLRVLSLIALVAIGDGAFASEAGMPSAAALERAREASTAAVEAAKRSGANPARAPRTAGIEPGTWPAPGVPALPGTREPTGAHDSLRALLDRARAGDLGAVAVGPATDEATPLVLVSFSMPEASLRTLLRQAGGIGVPLVLRGLVGDSMKRTVERLSDLLEIDTEGAPQGAAAPELNLMIDPTLFARFAVNAVPAFVLPLEPPAPCTPDGCPTPAHVRVAGDVTLDHALAVFAREAGNARARAIAGRWLRKLEDGA